MALALGPLLSEGSMKSRCGWEALADGLRPGTGIASESGDTSLAGFESGPAGESSVASSRIASKDVLTGLEPPPESGDTSLAGFAGVRRPQAPGGRIAIPAALR